jgi:hypothetical protein
MFTSLWPRRGAAKRPAPRGRWHKQRSRLYLEPLEERCLLSTFIPRPLVEVSNPDPLPTAPPGITGVNAALETYVTVNPTNPKNIVAAWMDHPFYANVASVTFDGGTTWQNVPIPVSQAAGGPEPGAGDPWVSFAPNGDLYASAASNAAVAVNKSTDGGLTWSQPIQLVTDPDVFGDKPSITADPYNPKFVYATWTGRQKNGSFNANSSEILFARSTDGGQSWQPEQVIRNAPGTDFDWGAQVTVLPDGTLIDSFTEGQFKQNNPGVLTLLRSTDHGQTWSAPIQAVVQLPQIDPITNPPFAPITDPDTGHTVTAQPMFPSVGVDRTTGQLYAVWMDGRFSDFQYNSIALSTSTDGGFTWSAPIQVNQTPNTVPPADRQAWNPSVAVAADGTVAVTYYDFRNNTPAPGCPTDYWMAFCHPTALAPATNPANWNEVRLTNTSFDLEQAPTFPFGNNQTQGAYWLGEYEGLAAAGNDFVAVWGMPDGSATPEESIFFRRVNDPPAAVPAVGQAGPALNLAPLAPSLFGIGTQIPPADPIPGPAAPSVVAQPSVGARSETVPQRVVSGIVPASSAVSSAPIGARDAVFAASRSAASNDRVWLIAPLLTDGLDSP